MPVWEGAGYGELLAMPNVPVRFNEYALYEWQGMRRTEIKIDDESGSPFMTIWQRAPHTPGPLEDDGLYRWKLDQIPLEQLILRETAVIDVPAGERHELTREEIERAVERADFRDGDAALVRTGWATREKAFELGDRYCEVGPSWSDEACLAMDEAMRARNSNIVMTDTPLIMTPIYQGWGWSMGPSRIVPRPKPWPSIEARERLMDLPAEPDPTKTEQPNRPASLGQGGYREWIKSLVAICKCLVNAGEITQPRVKMIIMPLLVRDGGASPCRFIAVEED
jgi:kynurenine formamidase